jgi:MIT (microtubule interacting and transport) domain
VANRARFLISEALEADERGNKKEALHLYIEAVEHCQQAVI